MVIPKIGINKNKAGFVRYMSGAIENIVGTKRRIKCSSLIPRSMKKTLVKLILILMLCSLTVSCTYSNSMQTEATWGADPLSSMIRFYRGPLNHLSSVRPGECPMYPSDSEYSLQSTQKHGMLLGWIMSVDRLMRCGRDETKLSPEVFINGKRKTYDPVDKNDFWWGDE
jgi:putative component of membrane protein insertase Oxa1/YidC/SpoIIIJ protein YidD